MKVRVPGSIANLGPGFDVLAMAVDLWLEVEAEPAATPDWRFEGEGAEALSAAPNPLSVLPFRGTVRNGIPLGVGLGSSAAARLAARALEGDQEPWVAAAAEEGHPDNVYAAARGGVRLVAGDFEAALPVPEGDVAMLVAAEPASTDQARRLLPRLVSIEDAVFNVGRTAWLVHLLHTGEADRWPAALEDRLHQPARRPLYPWATDVIAAANEHGCPAAISGAGPSVFALCPAGLGDRVAGAMARAASGRGRPLVTRVARSGMTVDAR